MSGAIADRLAALAGAGELRYAILVAGVGLGLTAYAAAAGRQVPPWERRVFLAIHGWPEGLRYLLWPVMQLGTLGGGLLLAVGAALWIGDVRVAMPVAAAVVLAWYLGKVVKAIVRRGRPADFFEALPLRESAMGMGFVSGHTAVAFAAATAAYPFLPPPAEGVALALAATVGVARIYFGAHLPLDVIGGAGLGLALGVSTALASAYVMALVA